MNEQPKQSGKELPSPRRPYAEPQLSDYGAVEKLTQGGGNTVIDHGSSKRPGGGGGG